jgi:hypothetical protein
MIGSKEKVKKTSLPTMFKGEKNGSKPQIILDVFKEKILIPFVIKMHILSFLF